MATRQEIEGLYTNVLGRQADQAGLDWWAQQANSGAVTLADIQRNFQGVAQAGSDPLKPQANPLLVQDSQRTTPAQPNSPQANPLIPQTYAAHDPALLERARGIGAQISAGGVPSADLMAQYESAADDLVYGTKPTGVTPGIGEALTSVYQNTLGRLPDAAGAEYWTKAFNDGMTLQQIEASIRSDKESQGRQPVYSDNPLFAGNEWTPPALAGRAMARMGLPYLQGGGTFDPNAPITADNVIRTVDEWKGYNSTLGTPNQQPVDYKSFVDNANMLYPGVSPTATNPLLPRGTAGTAPLATRPPTRFASEYPYESPIARQMAAANDQRATPMTQPVGFASDNPLLNRFGTQRLGEYTGARETPGNVPGPFRPTVNPLPGIVGAAPGASGSSGSSGSSGLPGGASSVLLAAAPALAGMAVPAALDLISKIPGGGAVADKIAGVLGANELAGGNLTFGELLKHPSIGTVVGSALAGLPDILSGDYAQGIGAGLGSYVGAAAGTAAGAGIGGIAGNFIIPGLGGAVGAFIGRKAGGLFGPGASVGPNAGQRMDFDPSTGRLTPGPSGQDNSGNQELGFTNKFMDGVAQVVNESLAQNGGKYQGSYSEQGWPLAMEVIKGKINIVDHAGNKKEFAGNQVEDAFKYAVGVATGYPGLRLQG